MILICGIPTESPVALVIQALREMEVEHVVFNQRRFAETHMNLRIQSGRITGQLRISDRTIPLESIQGVYTRLMDHQALPEMEKLPPESPGRTQCSALHEILLHWMEITPARVVNRSSPMGSNSSKPYQAQLIQKCGFEVPDTLITNEPGAVEAYRNEHEHIIYKSISGVRSIVQEYGAGDRPRLKNLRWCPTQFQQRVEGMDVRVHVIGREVFATAIRSDAVDYRYSRLQTQESAQLEAVELDDELAERCIRLSTELGLAFSGIDLRLSPDGRVYCFEVNPCPGYSYYEANTGQPISNAVARYLAGTSPATSTAGRSGMGQAETEQQETRELVGR